MKRRHYWTEFRARRKGKAYCARCGAVRWLVSSFGSITLTALYKDRDSLGGPGWVLAQPTCPPNVAVVTE